MSHFDRNYPRRQSETPVARRVNNETCGCRSDGQSTSNTAGVPSLAMAYIPNQAWGSLFELPVALQKGTIFEALDFPFYGEKFRCGNCRNR